MKTDNPKSPGIVPGHGVCVIDVSVDNLPAHMLRVSEFLEKNRDDGGPILKWELHGRNDRQPAMSKVQGPVAGIAAFLSYVYVDDEEANGTPTVSVR